MSSWRRTAKSWWGIRSYKLFQCCLDLRLWILGREGAGGPGTGALLSSTFG